MKQEIIDMAIDLCKSTQKPFTWGIPQHELAKKGNDLKSIIIDYQGYFGKRPFQDFKDFCKKCDELGFEVLPIEYSHLAEMTPLHGKKLVIQEKSNA